MTEPGGRRLPVRRLAATFLATLVGFGVFFALVGVEEAAATLRGADPAAYGLAVAATAGAFLVWGAGLGVVCGVLEHGPGLRRAVALFVATVFVNNVTPSGQAAGTPASAVVVARGIGADYETGLAATGTVVLVNNAVALALGAAGAGVAVVGLDPGGRRTLAAGAVAAVGLLVLLAATVAGAWRLRGRLGPATVRVLLAAARRFGRLPRVDPPDRAALERRVERLGRGADRVAAAPVRLAAVVGLWVVGHVLLVGALGLSLLALGGAVGFGVLLAVVPAARVAALAPTPGGFGGVEVGLVGLLVVVAGVDAAVAAAAVLVYRLATHWLPIVVGAGVAGAVLAPRA